MKKEEEEEEEVLRPNPDICWWLMRKGKCRVMALVIGKMGHMGHEVFAGGANGEGLRWLAANTNPPVICSKCAFGGPAGRSSGLGLMVLHRSCGSTPIKPLRVQTPARLASKSLAGNETNSFVSRWTLRCVARCGQLLFPQEIPVSNYHYQTPHTHTHGGDIHICGIECSCISQRAGGEGG